MYRYAQKTLGTTLSMFPSFNLFTFTDEDGTTINKEDRKELKISVFKNCSLGIRGWKFS